MNIEFQNTENDYKNFYKLHFKNELRKKIILVIFLPLFIGFACSDSQGQTFEWARFFLALVVSVLLMLLIFYYIPYWFYWNKIKKLIVKNTACLKKKRLTIIEEGLQIETASDSSILNWESIISCKSNEFFIYLLLADKKIYLIPKRAFASNIDAINFLGIIQSRMMKIRESIETSTKKKSPYKLGFWCLIPLIGAFVGIWLILYGIFKYKDKWIVLIGVAGIMWTVVLYSLLYYVSEYVR